MLWSLLGETTTIVSIGEREAIEVLEKAKLHALGLARLGSKWAQQSMRATEIKFQTGGRILALPATSGGRSFSGNVILDEFAYHQHPEQVWDGAGGTVMHGYKLRCVSTPNGSGNLFHQLWSDESAHRGFSLHSVTIDQAIEQGLRVDLDECWKMARGDPRVFDQLFRCSFLDGAEQYLPVAKIHQAVVQDFDPRLSGRRFAGLDIGLKKDLSVLIVVEQDADGVAHVVDMEECRRTAWEEQQDMVLRSAAYWDWDRLCVDSTGLGAVPCELLQSKLGKMRVEPVPFTQKSKEAMATLLYQAFNDGMVKMLRDTALIRDLCSIKRIITSTGAVRYDAPHTDQGHADRAWALALALQACERAPKRTRSMGDGDFAQS